MKKFSLVTLLALAANFAMAQDIDEIRNMAYLKQNVKAKEAVDKYLAVEKNAKKPEGWFYKAYITNELSKDTARSIDESSALKSEAFEIFKKYRQIDPKAELLEEQNNSPMFDIYLGFSSDLAIKAYTSTPKNIAAAHDNFKKGLEVHDYIYSNNIGGANGFKFAAIDTTLTLYTAITANELKKTDDAAIFYKKLTDGGVAGDDYIDAYQVLTDYYKNKKDKAAFDDILAKGRKLYPKNEEYWMAIEIEEAVNGVAKPAVFLKYEELMAKHPTNYTVAYNYAVELYNHINSDDAKNVNTSDDKTKLAEVLKKAIAIQSTFDANFLIANFLYNHSFDIGEEARKIKGPKPDDLKKRKALEAEAAKLLNDVIPYGESSLSLFAALPKKKTTDKIHYKQVLTMMKNIYDVKKDAAKSVQYDKLIKEAE
ncbi:MAG: hypothetical protein IPP72_22295 [Chitinophagaceae bacterium]|nr:hypothetical protein [Chitinophagaceae bacterium]